MMLTCNTCEIRHNLPCSAEGPEWCRRKAKTRWIERGSASPHKQSFHPVPSGLLTLPIVGYLRSHRLLTLLLSGFETRIRPWLKSKSCVHNAQYASGHYRTLGVIRSVHTLSPCWSTCCLTSQATAVTVKNTVCFSLRWLYDWGLWSHLVGTASREKCSCECACVLCFWSKQGWGI